MKALIVKEGFEIAEAGQDFLKNLRESWPAKEGYVERTVLDKETNQPSIKWVKDVFTSRNKELNADVEPVKFYELASMIKEEDYK